MESLKELIPFLNPESRLDLKTLALRSILAITGTLEGRQLLLKNPEILRQLIFLLQNDSATVVKDASLALINISGDEDGSSALLIISESSKNTVKDDETDNLIYLCFNNIINKDSKLADSCCMILSNMTRPHAFVERIIALAEKTGFTWNAILNAFTTNNYNNNGAKLHYLGSVFSNLSQSKKIQHYLIHEDQRIFQRLLSFVEFKESIIRRGGIIGTLRNCCFDILHHEVLMQPDIDIISYLLLPLAGPEEFTDEENDKLPIDLQYLPDTKKREEDPDIRIMLLEALEQLCATRNGREYLRTNNTYLILREFHKWEKHKAALLACENVVDILIKTEEEIGLDNLKEVDVPEEYKEKFHEMDKLYLQEEETEAEIVDH